MSQFTYDPYLPARETNGLGVAGFVCSLVGIFTGGLLSPIGLILSLIALGRRPRGFAVAGLIMGLLGTCGGLLILAMVVLGIAAVGAFFGLLILSNPEKTEMTADMITIAVAVEKYRDENHYLPASLGLVSLQESTSKDPWGQLYRYDIKDPKGEFDLVSSGVDKKFDTADDVKLSKLGEAWAPDGQIHIDGLNGKGGVVTVGASGSNIEVSGDDQGGNVKIKIGDHVIEVTGDEAGGRIDIGTQPSSRPEE